MIRIDPRAKFDWFDAGHGRQPFDDRNERYAVEAAERMDVGGVRLEGFDGKGDYVITVEYAGMTSGGRFAAR